MLSGLNCIYPITRLVLKKVQNLWCLRLSLLLRKERGSTLYMYMHGTYKENERGYFWASKEKKAQFTISFEVDRIIEWIHL